MASFTVDLIVFDVRNGDHTRAYVYMTAQDDCPCFVQGWHCKDFPVDVTTQEVFHLMFHGNADGSVLPFEFVSWNNCNAPELP